MTSNAPPQDAATFNQNPHVVVLHLPQPPLYILGFNVILVANCKNTMYGSASCFEANNFRKKPSRWIFRILGFLDVGEYGNLELELLHPET